MKNRKYVLAGIAGALLIGGVAVTSGSGYLQGRFDTSADLTRAEVVEAVVLAALGEQTATCGDFSDVPTTASYNPYVCAALDYGLITGDEDGTFGPEDFYTRSETAKIVYEAFGLDYTCEVPKLYRDVALDSWYAEYVNDLGIRSVYQADVKIGAAFRPDDLITENALDIWLDGAVGM